jgi:tRNA(Ile)-lysidine synthase
VVLTRAGRTALTAVHVAVRDALIDLGPGDVVLVACSGGPDSLVLSAVTAQLSRRRGWRAGAVVVDHGWSAVAGEAGRRAAETCREFGLDPVELIAVDSGGPGGPEAAARTARYTALNEAAVRHSADCVLLGHTLDDQAETVLLGLGRGSGARSLSGMPAVRGLYRRPLLGLRRDTIREACAELGLDPWLDPANDDPAYTRVRIRALAGELERALGPGVAEALARTADLLRDDADALEESAAELLTAAGAVSPPGLRGAAGGREVQALEGQALDVRVLNAAPRAVRRRALLAAARAAGCPPGALSHRHARALDELIRADSRAGGRSHLPGGVEASVRSVVGGRSVLQFESDRARGRSKRPDMGNLQPSPDPEPPS